MVDPLVQEAILQETERSGTDQCDVLVQARDYAREIVPSLSAGFYFRLIHGPLKRWMLQLFRVRVRVPGRGSDRAGGQNLNAGLRPQSPQQSRLRDRRHFTRRPGHPFVRGGRMGTLLAARRAAPRPRRLLRPTGVGQSALPGRPRRPTSRPRPGPESRRRFFIEGRFSDDGKLGSPRLGLLDYAVRAFDPESRRDVAFVPVAVNYDRVIEDKNLQIMKAQGKSATRTGSWRATAAFLGHQLWLRLNRRWRPFGYATLSVGEPVSLRDWLASRDFDPRNADRGQRFQEVGCLAEHLMERIAEIMPVCYRSR